ncbi:MAG: PIN domain nuclease [Terracidiphilus sp.]|jgi:predicted nucleic acid-binding protein
MVIVDTSVWIDALRGIASPQAIWLKQTLGTQEVGLTSLILCEVLQGVRSNSEFRGFCADFQQFAVFDSGGAKLAIAAAKNYRILRDQGITIRKTIDCIIATFCIESGHQLLHKDRDFNAFEIHLGLRVLHPPAIALN